MKCNPVEIWALIWIVIGLACLNRLEHISLLDGIFIAFGFLALLPSSGEDLQKLLLLLLFQFHNLKIILNRWRNMDVIKWTVIKEDDFELNWTVIWREESHSNDIGWSSEQKWIVMILNPGAESDGHLTKIDGPVEIQYNFKISPWIVRLRLLKDLSPVLSLITRNNLFQDHLF